MANAFSPWHLLLILAVILLLFGAAKLPALAKSVGQSARVFRGEMKAMKEEDAPKNADGTDAATPTAESSSTSNAGGASDPKP
ncbi:twin-arginine translocase TatA/TatE family subunit [Microbacterium aquimaris]|uniref:twin-arginine translocase TatA/TatE family subunit n=1 Tax=Microbacterium aquimaris TaxID=459816 RepID=UPI002AD2E8EB|nr:twin-arginine translocase TatA/TatE family subunit [Microbacterium aquimaris]MDZ8276093.1 twin-arginine translocase TatA/TatE family subunit [Microbacterium aquimaris]